MDVPDDTLRLRRIRLIQGQKLLQNALRRHADGPVPAAGGAVGRTDGLIQAAVGQIEPGRALVVEVRQGPFGQHLGALGVTRQQTGIARDADFAWAEGPLGGGFAPGHADGMLGQGELDGRGVGLV